MRKSQTKNAVAAKWRAREELLEIPDAPIPKIPSGEFLAASLITGTTYTQLKNATLIMGAIPPPPATFYRKQQNVEPKIIAATEVSMTNARQHFNGSMGVDCRWSAHKNGAVGTVTALDTENRTVLARSTLVKHGGNRANANYNGASNNMETLGIQDIMKTMATEGKFESIKSIVRDRDNKTGKILECFGVREKELHDPGHYRKNFATLFASFTSKHKVVVCYCKERNENIKITRPLYGLAGRLNFWLNHCLGIEDPDFRVSSWENCVQHFIDDHSKCYHTDDKVSFIWNNGLKFEELRSLLFEFVHSQSDIIRKIQPGQSTQICESLNAGIMRSTPKRVPWKHINMRIDTAILKQNDPLGYRQQILNCCGVKPLPQIIENKLQHDERILSYKLAEKRNQEAKDMKNKQRRINKRKNKEDPNGDYHVKKLIKVDAEE